MKRLLLLSVALVLAAEAHAIKPCEELKSEISEKIAANGVAAYTLEIIDADQDDPRKVVGTCDGGTKKIVYVRN